MSGEYLSWWLAGIGLGTLAVSRWVLENRVLGVSGLIQRTVEGLADRKTDKSARSFAEADPEAIKQALREATMEAFGDDARPAPPSGEPTVRPKFVSLGAATLFLVAIAVGGAIASAQRGAFEIRTTLGTVFEGRFGDGWAGAIALVAGGILVGFGTRMAGGCTSGHGLSGCSRFQPGSLVATATFMAAGVAVALALGAAR